MESTVEKARILKERANRLIILLKMGKRIGVETLHDEMQNIQFAVESLGWRLGHSRGNRCTQTFDFVPCDGFYEDDHCTVCGHEEYQ